MIRPGIVVILINPIFVEFLLQLRCILLFKSYWLHTSWGRIGAEKRGLQTKQFPNVIEAIESFNEKLKLLTIERNYTPIQCHDRGSTSQFLQENQELLNIPQSNLDPMVNELMEKLFNTNALMQVVLNYKLDVKNSVSSPLGRLSNDEIEKGMSILCDIYSVIKKNLQHSEYYFRKLTEQFYRAVPHYFGDARPDTIITFDDCEKLYNMLLNMRNIGITYEIIDEGARNGKNALEFYYDSLKTEIVPIDHSSHVFKNIVKMTENTHGPTHNIRLIVEEVYQITREEEIDRFKPFENEPGNRILWHGSRISNFVGILRNGLRCAPKEAVSSGDMFGPGKSSSKITSSNQYRRA